MIKTLIEIPLRKTIPLWNEKWDVESLLAKKRDGEIAFNRGFRQIPFSEELAVFKSIDKAIQYGVTWQDLLHQTCHKYMSVDLSTSTRPGTVIVVFGVSHNGKKVIIEVDRGKWDGPQTAQKIAYYNDIHKPLFVAIEDNAYQVVLPQMMKAAGFTGIPIVGHHTGRNKTDIEIGLQSLEVELANDMWVIPFEKQHDNNCVCGKCTLVNEARSYPLGDSDDAVMAWWIGKEQHRQRSANTWSASSIRRGGPTRTRQSLKGL